jgi:integrase
MVTTALRERMRSILRIRNYSPRTEETYIAAVAHFAQHFGKSPDQLGAAQVVEYQIWLREHKHVSSTLMNQTVCALRFFYGQVLECPEVVQRISYARTGRRLPVVLSVEETARFLGAIRIPRYRVLLTTIYSAGLRLNEALGLRACDIDSSRMLIRVFQGKGKNIACRECSFVALRSHAHILLQVLRCVARLLISGPELHIFRAWHGVAPRLGRALVSRARSITHRQRLRHGTSLFLKRTFTVCVGAGSDFGAARVTAVAAAEPLACGDRTSITERLWHVSISRAAQVWC